MHCNSWPGGGSRYKCKGGGDLPYTNGFHVQLCNILTKGWPGFNIHTAIVGAGKGMYERG